MSACLPTHDLRFCTAEETANITQEFTEHQGQNISDDAAIGFALEVTLRYPEEIKEKFTECPPLAVKRVVEMEEHSPFTRELATKYGVKMAATPKLISDLHEKKNYKLHYINLKYILSLGVELVEVHRVVQFQQRPWLKPYIDHNNQRRGECSSTSEKDFYKLKNNSCFGKLFEDPRKYQSVVMVRDANLFRRRVSRINYHSCLIQSEDTALVMMDKTQVEMKKPSYLGSVILDLSKEIMLRFWYNHLFPTFQKPGSRLSLCTTDTDSFLVGITYSDPSRSFWHDLATIAHTLDTGNYSDSHPFFQQNVDQMEHLKQIQRANKGVLAKFKDEAGGDRFATEGVFLKAKMYSVLYSDGTPKQVAKGIQKSVIKKMTLNDYKSAIETELPQRHTMRAFRSERHQIYMVEIEKNSLSLYDDKRWAVDKIQTLPYGHPRAISN